MTKNRKKNSEPQNEKIEWVDPKELQWSIIHETLPDEIVKRIKAVHMVFAEVDPMPSGKMVDNFRYEANPEREVSVWEAMAGTYTAYTAKWNLSLARQHELYGILLVGSGVPVEEALDHLELELFTKPEAREVLETLFRSGLKEPSPIRAEKHQK